MATKPAKSRKSATNKATDPEVRRYQAPALAKGLDIIELLSLEPKGLAPKSIAAKLGRSVNEIFRMLICLEEREYIYRDSDSDVFTLSLKLFELGLRNPPTKRLVEAASVALFDLGQKVRQSCHVAIHSGGNVMVVAQQNSPEPMFFTVSLGTLVPLHKAVSGLVLLAYQLPEIREHWLSQTNATKAELAYLRKSWPTVLKNGFFTQESKTMLGVTELAFPVFGHTGSAVATVSVPISRTTSGKQEIEDYIADTREAALEISRQIGWLGECP